MLTLKKGAKVVDTKSSGCGGFVKGNVYFLSADVAEQEWVAVTKDSNGRANGWVPTNFKKYVEPFGLDEIYSL